MATASRALLVLLAAGALLALSGFHRLWPGETGLAFGERSQFGSLIVSLDGGISPRKLPRHRPTPVAVHFDGGLRTADGSLLPRVVKIEIGMPSQGIVSTRGLPVCGWRRLRDTRSWEALAACRPALVGQGRLGADVLLPNQGPFTVEARLLLFNGRYAGRRALLLHAYATRPPTSVTLPFFIRRREGWLGTALVATVPRWLGPWPRFARFDMTLSRRYVAAGRRHSFLSASCPIPPRFTAGFFPFARITYTLAGGRRVSTEIVRGCRASRGGG